MVCCVIRSLHRPLTDSRLLHHLTHHLPISTQKTIPTDRTDDWYGAMREKLALHAAAVEIWTVGRKREREKWKQRRCRWVSTVIRVVTSTFKFIYHIHIIDYHHPSSTAVPHKYTLHTVAVCRYAQRVDIDGHGDRGKRDSDTMMHVWIHWYPLAVYPSLVPLPPYCQLFNTCLPLIPHIVMPVAPHFNRLCVSPSVTIRVWCRPPASRHRATAKEPTAEWDVRYE